MSFAIFIHRSDTKYHDDPDVQYQFPRQYLTRVQACINDSIIYYEPTRGGTARGYFATAKISGVKPDTFNARMFIAIITPGSYFEFPKPVPFVDATGYAERGLLNQGGRLSGRAQAAVRALSNDDFTRILRRGLGNDLLLPRDITEDSRHGFEEEQALYAVEEPRLRLETLLTRAVRDRVFRQIVLRAYDECCALSGLKLINGGGRAEVAAAHIRPVAANGPDRVTNGLALSGTAHWMFDRGLVSLSDNLDILISREVNDLDGVKAFLNANGRAREPRFPHQRPHSRFLTWHREHCFKQ